MANLLIVDDELGMRQFLTHLFEREGHIVRAAENGREAMQAYLQTKTIWIDTIGKPADPFVLR